MPNQKLEQNLNSIKRDFRNLQTAIRSSDPDSYTLAMLDKLNRSILENRRLVEELIKKA
jgi:hypothetical protein